MSKGRRSFDGLVNSFVFSNVEKSLDEFKKGQKKDEEKPCQEESCSRPVLEHQKSCSRPVLEHQKSCSRPVLEQVYDTCSSRSCSRPVLEHDPSEKPHEKTELTNTQMIVYKHLLDRGINGVFNKTDLSKHTGIPYNTVRNTVRRLQALGLVFVDSYSNVTKQLHYRISNTKRPVLCHVLEQVYNTTHKSPVIEQDSLYNNNNILNNIIINARVREELENHPEMEFWRQQGVTAEMIEANIKKTGRPEELFLQDMKFYAFKAEAGHFKNKTISDHLAFLIGGIKEFKGWSKPDGYVCAEDREIEALKLSIEGRKRKIKEIEELKEADAFLKWYQKYIENPESEEVVAVMKLATDFELRQIRNKEDKQKWLKTLWVRINGQ